MSQITKVTISTPSVLINCIPCSGSVYLNTEAPTRKNHKHQQRRPTGRRCITKLSEAEVKKWLSETQGWKLSESEITKKFTFKSFIDSINFVNGVAKLAEEANHHPDIVIKYNTVRINLSTHSESGVTEKDLTLATKIDTIA